MKRCLNWCTILLCTGRSIFLIYLVLKTDIFIKFKIFILIKILLQLKKYFDRSKVNLYTNSNIFSFFELNNQKSPYLCQSLRSLFLCSTCVWHKHHTVAFNALNACYLFYLFVEFIIHSSIDFMWPCNLKTLYELT